MLVIDVSALVSEVEKDAELMVSDEVLGSSVVDVDVSALVTAVETDVSAEEVSEIEVEVSVVEVDVSAVVSVADVSIDEEEPLVSVLKLTEDDEVELGIAVVEEVG